MRVAARYKHRAAVAVLLKVSQTMDAIAKVSVSTPSSPFRWLDAALLVDGIADVRTAASMISDGHEG
jgi:hypothetical protein